MIPRKLSVVPASPHFDRETCDKIDKVFVDGVLIPKCRAYDMDEGWAAGMENGVWLPKVYGEVTVKLK